MATQSEAVPASPRRRRLPLIVLALAAIGALGGAAWHFLPLAQAKAPQAPEPVKPIFVTIEPLTVNLHSDGKPRFLHVGVALRVNDEHEQARIAEAMPELRSRLLLLLSNREPDTLSTPAQKTALADEIRNELNRPLGPGLPPQRIAGIAFNAFVVQ